MSNRRPSNYSYPKDFKSLSDVNQYARDLYRELLENDSAGDYLSDVSTDKDLKALIVRPEWYKAKGDGVTDDTKAIQDAIDSLANGGTVKFSPKTYLVTETISIPATQAITLEGCGWGHNSSGDGATVIKTTASGVHILTAGVTSADRTCDVIIRNLRLQGAPGTGNGILIRRVHNMLVDRVRIWGCGQNGIELDRAYANKFIRCYVNNNVENGIEANENNDFTVVDGCAILANGGNGIYFSNGSSSGTRIIYNDIEGNAIGIKWDTGSPADQSETILIHGNYFESQVGKNMSIGEDAGTTRFLDAPTISNNQINVGAGTAATNAVGLGRCRRPNIIDNVFISSNLTITADTTPGFCLGNMFKLCTYPTPNWALFDTSVVVDSGERNQSRFGGTLPQSTYQSGGWTLKHHAGVSYDGSVYELGTNISLIDGTTANLDDTSYAGYLIRVDPNNIKLYTATAGANPRTITETWSIDISGNTSQLGNATLSGNRLFLGNKVGVLPHLDIQSAGWDTVHPVGCHYSGESVCLGENLLSTSLNQGNLYDTSYGGSFLMVYAGGIYVATATAGANPRTLTKILDTNYGRLSLPALSSYATDADAGTAGLVAGDLYTVLGSSPLQLAVKA